jgi:hypothetical protein
MIVRYLAKVLKHAARDYPAVTLTGDTSLHARPSRVAL